MWDVRDKANFTHRNVFIKETAMLIEIKTVQTAVNLKIIVLANIYVYFIG